MPETDPFRLFSDRLEQLGIPYMVTGSVASMVYLAEVGEKVEELGLAREWAAAKDLQTRTP